MSEFIVLGQIPGTHIQITFVFWVILMLALFIASLVWTAHRTHAFRNWLIALSLFLVTRSKTIDLSQ